MLMDVELLIYINTNIFTEWQSMQRQKMFVCYKLAIELSNKIKRPQHTNTNIVYKSKVKRHLCLLSNTCLNGCVRILIRCHIIFSTNVYCIPNIHTRTHAKMYKNTPTPVEWTGTFYKFESIGALYIRYAHHKIV